MTRASRILCRKLVRLNHNSKCLGKIIDFKIVKTEAFAKAATLDPKAIRKMNTFTPKKRVNMEVVVKRLGLKDLSKQVSVAKSVFHNQQDMPGREIYF